MVNAERRESTSVWSNIGLSDVTSPMSPSRKKCGVVNALWRAPSGPAPWVPTRVHPAKTASDVPSAAATANPSAPRAEALVIDAPV